jgi:predicted SAM-dependent methyltransferase
MRKQYIEVPMPMACGKIRNLWQALVGILFLPCYVTAALILKTPGVTLQIKCAKLAMRLLITRRISFRKCYTLICFPMDSTRYFEFHEVLAGLVQVPFERVLDVSSPRILPLMLLMQNRMAVAEIINPDRQDLQKTKQLALALGLTDRCTFMNTTIEMINYPAETFDLITCISVLEHIPTDKEAVASMWSLLRPGGRLILTVPCMAYPLEQYISRNDYGVLSPDSDGYTFWQRYYNMELLQSVIFNITKLPVRMAIYGERSPGYFFRNATMKRLLGSLYPFWRESYMMAEEYSYFQTIADLPGEGVVMMEFTKP